MVFLQVLGVFHCNYQIDSTVRLELNLWESSRQPNWEKSYWSWHRVVEPTGIRRMEDGTTCWRGTLYLGPRVWHCQPGTLSQWSTRRWWGKTIPLELINLSSKPLPITFCNFQFWPQRSLTRIRRTCFHQRRDFQIRIRVQLTRDGPRSFSTRASSRRCLYEAAGWQGLVPHSTRGCFARLGNFSWNCAYFAGNYNSYNLPAKSHSLRAEIHHEVQQHCGKILIGTIRVAEVKLELLCGLGRDKLKPDLLVGSCD